MKLDIDRRQYRLLLGLLRDLGDRSELTGQLGLDRKALGQIGVLYFIMGALLSLIVRGHPSAHAFLMAAVGASTFVLIPILVSNAADAFMNPAEASVLSHQPIRGGTYLAAKATYLLYAAVRVVVPLNAVPAIAGLTLAGTRAIYPITHTLAVVASSVLTVLLLCGVFGVLFRIVPLARLRTTAMWMQLVAGMILTIGPQLLRYTPRGLGVSAPYWSVLPMTWFAVLGLAGQPGRQALAWAWALPAMVACAVLVVYGVRSLTQQYLTRVVWMLRVRKTGNGRRWRFDAGALVRRLSGAPSGRAAFAFLTRMAPRDWQFRRALLRMAGPFVVLPLLNAQRSGSLLLSPLTPGMSLPAIHAVPHVLGMLTLSIALFVVYSDQHEAAWVFLTAPMAGLRSFVRGIYAALWVLCVALPHALILVAGTALWGLGATALFVVYSLAVTTLYLSVALRFISGLPFASPPRTGRSETGLLITIALFVVAFILIAVQRVLLFPSPFRVVAASLVSAVLAAVVARGSLRALEANVVHQLSIISAGTSALFARLDDR